MTDKVTPTQAVERIEKYLNELAKMRYFDKTITHYFIAGDDVREASLNIADIKALIEIASHASQARLEGVKLGLQACLDTCNNAGGDIFYPDVLALDPEAIAKGDA